MLLIMTDDSGYGVPGTFGGVIPTPALDRVAKTGLRYTQFHSTALCSPTRAALITGRNHHSAGFGVISEQATGFPGYNSIIPKDKATIGRILHGKRLRHVMVRQGPQHARLRIQPARAVRSMADRHGLRVLLRLRRRRHQPVAAESLPQHHADLSLTSATGLEPHDRDGRRRRPVAERVNADRPGEAVLRAITFPAASMRRTIRPGVGGEDQHMHCSTRAGTSCASTIFANQKRLGVIPPDAN